ncbi:MAG TPA: hypothetical protein VF185_01520 [Patescibacteria group bacterium]
MISESKRGREIHALAEKAREGEQNFLKSLNLLNEATIAYLEDKDYLGASEAQGSRFIALKHLYERTKEDAYLTLATLAAQAAVEIAEEHKINQALPLAYFNLGKAYEEEENYKKALTPFRKAFKKSLKDLPERHNRPALKADIKAHLAFIEYMCGNKSAITKLEEAIKELESSDEGKYTKDVWLSGAHMRTAKALRKNNPKKAKEHLEKARQIIESNPNLTLRKGQLEEIENKLKLS